jgi:hypothetical protein
MYLYQQTFNRSDLRLSQFFFNQLFIFLSSRLVPYTLFMCVIGRAFGSSCIRERTLLSSVNELEVKPMLSKRSYDPVD